MIETDRFKRLEEEMLRLAKALVVHRQKIEEIAALLDRQENAVAALSRTVLAMTAPGAQPGRGSEMN